MFNRIAALFDYRRSSAIEDTQIRSLAERLSRQRPWASPDENWLAAERALRHKPWMPWIICFSGDKERSGWDWFELGLKTAIPILILMLSSLYSSVSAERERENIRQTQEGETVSRYIIDIKTLVLEENLLNAPVGSPVNGISAALTMTALSQVRDPAKKTQLIRFLHGIWELGDKNKLDLSFVDLKGADLRGMDLSGVSLFRADLRGSRLVNTKLIGSDLMYADLRGTDLSGAYLDEALCGGIHTDKATFWGSQSRSGCRLEATANPPMHRELIANATPEWQAKSIGRHQQRNWWWPVNSRGLLGIS
jgi:hypothetical protein